MDGQAPRPLPAGFVALAINDSKQMAGLKAVAGNQHVFLLEADKLTDLGTLSSVTQWAYALPGELVALGGNA